MKGRVNADCINGVPNKRYQKSDNRINVLSVLSRLSQKFQTTTFPTTMFIFDTISTTKKILGNISGGTAWRQNIGNGGVAEEGHDHQRPWYQESLPMTHAR